MTRFVGARDAKEFLVARIVVEAQREGVSLSEIERKMLYFSETAWTLPDIREVSDAFDPEYDQDEYEKKIARLIRNARERARKENKQDLEAWSDAIRTLGKEDHYILEMIRQAGGSARPPGDLLKLWGTALVVVCVGVFVLPVLSARLSPKLTGKSFAVFLWAIATCVAGAYLLLCVCLSRQRADQLIRNVARKLLGHFGPTK